MNPDELAAFQLGIEQERQRILAYVWYQSWKADKHGEVEESSTLWQLEKFILSGDNHNA